MSKADQLGTSAAFGRANGASARRRATDAAIGSSRSEDLNITQLPPDSISCNPDNPRDHLRDLDETVQSVREVGIILPIIVASVDAYLKERPERAGELEDGTQYIVVDGHRRLEAARRAGLPMIDVRVDNDRVSTDEKLLETAFVANYHRDNMTELEEAHALHALVEHYGSQTKAAQRLGIRQNVISAKLSVLKLAPDLQADLQRGERTYEQVRNLGKLSPAEQRATADARAAAARAKEAAPAPKLTAGAEDYPAGIIDSPASSLVARNRTPQPPLTPSAPTPDNVPEPRHAPPPDSSAAPQGQTKKFPYDNGLDAAFHLDKKMSDEEFFRMAEQIEKMVRRRRATAAASAKAT